jgi:hypothetical protein
MEYISEKLGIKDSDNFIEYKRYVWQYSFIVGILASVLVHLQFGKGTFAWAIIYSLLGPAALRERLIDPVITKDVNKAAGAAKEMIATIADKIDASYKEDMVALKHEIDEKVAQEGQAQVDISSGDQDDKKGN